MEALVKPISLTDEISTVRGWMDSKKKADHLPVNIWGISKNTRPLIIESLKSDSLFTLVVTYDDARAEKLYEDYRFYDRDVYLYPAKDALFYYADVHGNLTSARRLEILKRIYKNEHTVIITTIDGIMDKLPDMKYFKRHSFELSVGQEIEMDDIKKRLVMLGYENVAVVESRGQFSARGGILDIYPLTEECPCRVEFFGDEIDSIRYFDEGSQRSIENVDSIEVLPASEYVLSNARKRRGIDAIEAECEKIAGAFKKEMKTESYARLRSYVRNIKEEVMEYSSTSGLDSFVSYFFTTCVSFLDYLPEETPIFIDEPESVLQRASAYAKEFSISMQARLECGYILPGQADVLYNDKETVARVLERYPVLLSEFYRTEKDWNEKEALQLETKGIGSYRGDTDRLISDIRMWRKDGYKIVYVSPSATRGKRLVDVLTAEDIPAFFSVGKERLLEPKEVMVTKGSLQQGYRVDKAKIVCICENELFGERKTSRKRFAKKYEGERYNSLDEITVGDYVVHERHGIGIYKGIEKVKTSDGRERDYINIDYDGGGKLFIPVEQLSLIGKYSSKDSKPPKLHKLGGEQWTKTRARVKSNVDNIADELIALYAVRQNKKGYSYSKDTVWQTEFEELFPYEETPDQLHAIEDTKRDMESTKIMDRLICGDVGFGKTEVAIRAAFKAVQDGKQVAYLVPTTILAEQHMNTFVKRMKDYPINIKSLSRFCTTKQAKETIEGLKNGSVDIVVGTHRLLSKDVSFKSLGLLIIDEEQRFGVKHKESIKQMKNNVDVLTLTATPIPRTLHMSLIGVRDMSILEEPPVDRRPIQTYVMEYDREIVKEAISRELARKGQVYYVYNRVDDIERITGELRAILPDAVIEFAHGKMRERELEDIMHAFINGDIDVLVSTTIIETGLDIPNVNTMIIHNADNFGLAQLYQLRGRVGRSDRSAYAFLMYQRDKVIKEVAQKRLSAIREFTELGSGYKISMKDLEIRGAGNVLGSSQSGHMEEIGYDLYVKLLNKAIRSRLGEDMEEDFDTSVDIPVDAYIPDEYVRSEYLKLELYKRISHIENDEDAEAVVAEAEDRFGELPKAMDRLIQVALIRAKAHKANMTHIRYANGCVQYIMKDGARIDVDKIPKFIKKYKGDLKLITLKESGFAVKTSSLIQENMLTNIAGVIDDIYDNLITKE
ncbi:MAG: transcription-repair coupling factor [Eubacterium sp.]|nr:transcription-repair coupling factor [Eubacterium sp.]